MKKTTLLATLLATATLHATSSDDLTIVNQQSEDFLLGKETQINMKLRAQDDKDMWLKLGIRLQGTFESKTSTKSGGTAYENSDAYLRRTRLEVQAGFDKKTSFTMDIRNDKVNSGDKGEQTFNVGDAYIKIKKPFDTSALNFKLYRAKIDVSRTETIKSARVIAYDRPYVADEAAQYITHNRRGTNVQAYGDFFGKKIQYQVATGDATYSGKMKDATGTSLDDAVLHTSIARQSFFYGGKVNFSPFNGWEETQKTETYFGKGKHFTFGASYWAVPTIITDGGVSISRSLVNAEISAHYKGAFIQAEYFAFDGFTEDWETLTTSSDTGKSEGWYATGEYVFVDLGFIAPFFRYESWDKFLGKTGYNLESTLYGINWYLRGNTTKFGFIVQNDTYGVNTGDKKEQSIRVTSQWFF